LTSHWISLNESNGCLTHKATLIGFHRLKKKHSGTNIAKAILHLLDWAGITLNVGLPLIFNCLEGFCKLIKDGNQCGWFTRKTTTTNAFLLEAVLEVCLVPTITLLDPGQNSIQCQIPHNFQHSMSSELMPVLSCTIISFKMFMMELEKLREQHKILKPWTKIGLHWATKYYIRMDDTDMYVMTMFLNPAIRFSWIQAQWEVEYIQSSRAVILN
ncbi:hypothetical protein EI94DRAFT_1493682, partial [Lactarius quietus]